MTIYIKPDSSPAYAEANTQPMVGWRNVLREGTLQSAGGTGNARENALDENTVDYWQASAGNVLRSIYDSTVTADFALIAAHTLAGSPISVQSYNGTAWSTVVTATPATNDPFLIIFPSASALGWGLKTDNAGILGVAWIGPRIVIPGGVTPGYAPVWASRMVSKWGGGTRRGHWMGQRVDAVTARIAPNFMPIPHDFALNDMRDFRERYNDGRAFVWAAAPSVFPEDVAYCWAEDGEIFQPVPLAGGDLCTLSLAMTAYCEP